MSARTYTSRHRPAGGPVQAQRRQDAWCRDCVSGCVAASEERELTVTEWCPSKQTCDLASAPPGCKIPSTAASVSTDDQTCERRERDLRAFARRAGHKVVAVFKETGSGADIGLPERAKVLALMDIVRRNSG